MGEFIDTIHSAQKINTIKEKDVLLNYTLKTARYSFDCPLVTGAILAGADERDIKKLSALGILIGQAFQIQDDIIGIFDSQKNIGKSILSDLTESKKTLLVCHAYRQLKLKKRKLFSHYFNKPKKTYNDLIAIRKIFLGSGSLQYCLQEIQNRIEKTINILEKIKIKKKYNQIIKDALFFLFKNSQQIAKHYQLDFQLYRF